MMKPSYIYFIETKIKICYIIKKKKLI